MILVTGANGFIGKYVVEFISENNEILALDNNLSNSINNKNIIFICCDITDISGLENIFKQYKITKIIHLASLLNSKSNQNPGLATKVNIFGSLNLLELAAKYKTEKFIYGSSISIYGALDSSEDNPIDESVRIDPSNIYGSTKRYVEFLGSTYSNNHNIDFISVRISTVIGPGAINTSSPWRSKIYNYNNEKTINIPYHKNDLLPLIPVKNIALMLSEILSDINVPHKIYNTPSETWKVSDLEIFLKKKNPDLQFIYNDKNVNDIPVFINGNLFLNDFSFKPVSVEESLNYI
jgi:nucleoside-diphosphate-sugar epimerase